MMGTRWHLLWGGVAVCTVVLLLGAAPAAGRSAAMVEGNYDKSRESAGARELGRKSGAMTMANREQRLVWRATSGFDPAVAPPYGHWLRRPLTVAKDHALEARRVPNLGSVPRRLFSAVSVPAHAHGHAWRRGVCGALM